MAAGIQRAAIRATPAPGLNMTAFDYIPVALAVLAVAARIVMFLPRQRKSAEQAG